MLDQWHSDAPYPLNNIPAGDVINFKNKTKQR